MSARPAPVCSGACERPVPVDYVDPTEVRVGDCVWLASPFRHANPDGSTHSRFEGEWITGVDVLDDGSVRVWTGRGQAALAPRRQGEPFLVSERGAS